MKRKFQSRKELKDFSKICATLSNTTRISILERIATCDFCITGDFMEMEEVSKFTVGQNVKQLAKVGIINGSFTRKTMSYCIDYKKLEEWKNVVDEFYLTLIKNKDRVNPDNKPCSGKEGI